VKGVKNSSYPCQHCDREFTTLEQKNKHLAREHVGPSKKRPYRQRVNKQDRLI
jgi:hypothetical protein